MKKLTLIIIFLLFSTNVLAQNFDIKILDYDAETQNARIQIQNIGSTEVHDLEMKIDDIVEKSLTPIFKPNTAFATFLTLPSGEHEITLTTREGITTTKTLYFPPTEEQIQKNLEKQKQFFEQKKQQLQQPEQPRQQEVSEKKFNYKSIYIPVILIIALIIIYLLYKKFKQPSLIKPKNIPINKK